MRMGGMSQRNLEIVADGFGFTPTLTSESPRWSAAQRFRISNTVYLNIPRSNPEKRLFSRR
jgi:hypothetical protein